MDSSIERFSIIAEVQTLKVQTLKVQTLKVYILKNGNIIDNITYAHV